MNEQTYKDIVRSFKALEERDELLNKIRSEIEREEKWLMKAGCNIYNVEIAFGAIKSVLAESEDKE